MAMKRTRSRSRHQITCITFVTLITFITLINHFYCVIICITLISEAIGPNAHRTNTCDVFALQDGMNETILPVDFERVVWLSSVVLIAVRGTGKWRLLYCTSSFVELNQCLDIHVLQPRLA